MSSLFSKKENVSLLINIHNGGVNTTLASFSKGQIPKFLYAANTAFAGDKSDSMELPAGMTSILDLSISEAIKRGWDKIDQQTKNISHIVVSFSSPWFVPKTKNISLFNETPFVISKKFLTGIAENEGEIFIKELAEKYQETKEAQFSVIEKNIIHAKINGYVVDDTIGKKTKNLEATIYLSAILKREAQKVMEIIMKNTHIPEEDVYIHSFSLISFSAVRDCFGDTPDFLILNIDSEMTDMILVNDSVIKQTASFPFGNNTIVRQIAKTSNISTEIAESQLMMYLSRKTDEPVTESMQNILTNLEKEWAVYLEDSLLGLSKDMQFPRKLFLLCEAKTSHLFINFLKLQKNDITADFRKYLDILLLDESTLSGLYSNDFRISIDRFHIILALFYNKLFQNQ